jgi:hypothetical protein
MGASMGRLFKKCSKEITIFEENKHSCHLKGYMVIVVWESSSEQKTRVQPLRFCSDHRGAAQMDERTFEHGITIVMLAAIVLLAITALAHRHASSYTQALLATAEEDLAREQQFSQDTFSENEQLRNANKRLRERVIVLSTNLSVAEGKTQACVERIPALQPIFQNTSALHRRVSLNDLDFGSDAVTLNMNDLIPGVIAPSGSMLPLLYQDTIVLEKAPPDTADIFLGDIIIFEAEGNRIIHRVIKIGWDDQGWFAVTRGDNNPKDDPYRVRFEQVRGVVVGIIY